MRQLSNAKLKARQRRSVKTRHKHITSANRFSSDTRPVIVISKSNQHIYAQLISFKDHKSMVLVQASTLEKDFDGTGTKTEKARSVGKLLAARAKKLSITKVAFDRNGFKYHGRIKALADAAREEGMDF